MSALRMVVLAGSIGAAMVGALYAAAQDAAASDLPSIREDLGATSEPASTEALPAPSEPMPVGVEIPDDVVAEVDLSADLVDPETGMRLGPITFHPTAAVVEAAPVDTAATSDHEASHEARREVTAVSATSSRAPRMRTRRAPRRTTSAPQPGPRLHPDAGRHVIAIARGMIARRELIQGSCYRYISEVFARAGHEHWRTRRVVYRAGRRGPYADLSLIRPGDWLYIVNHPDRTPVGTHSVLFVGWEDQSRGYARVIEHSGWGAPRSGYERGYDVSRTYRIIRPINTRR